MSPSKCRIGCIAAFLSAALAGPASADLFWQGAGDWHSNQWATASGGPYTEAWVAGSNAQFETTAGTITLGAPTSVGNLTFNVGQTVAGTSALTLVGTTATVQAGASAHISAALSGDTLNKTGAGTLILSGNNTHTGLTTVSAGILNVRSNTALGTVGGSTTVASGAALQLQGGITVTGEALTLDNNGPDWTGALRSMSGDNTWDGPISLLNSSRIRAEAGLLTLSGSISLEHSTTNYHLILETKGSGSILVSGDIAGGPETQDTLTISSGNVGVVTLGGTNTYSGNTYIGGGTLRVTGGAAIPDASAVRFNANTILELGNHETVGSLTGSATATIKVGANTLTVGAANNAAEAVFGGVIQGTGGITKTGTGMQTLSGANTYTGGTLVNAGVLRISHDTALGTNAGGTTVTSGASLHLQGGITVTGESLSLVGDGIHYANEPGALRNISGDNTWTGAITIGSAATRIVANAGSLTISGNIALTGSATNHLILQGTSNILITGNITGGGSGSQTLTRSGVGSGIMTLAGTNTYLGVTTISGGTLQVGNGGSTGTLGAGNVVNNAKLVVNRSGEITLAQVISGSGTLTQQGSGTLTLSGANTYSGLTTVSAGVLKITHNTALGTGAAGTTVAAGAALHLQGGITVTGEALTLAGTGNNWSGAMRNISGDNTWAGPATITGGQVNVGSSSGLLTFSGPISLAASETQYNLVLTPSTSGPILVSGNISGGVDGSSADRRSVTLGSGSTGVVTLSGANTYLGRTSINGGTLRVEGGAAIPDASMVIFGGSATLELGHNETVGSLSGVAGATIRLNAHTLTVGADNHPSLQEFAGTMTGTGGLTKTGTGIQALTGASTYTGDTIIEQGILHVASWASIHADSAIKVGEDGTYRVVVVANGTGASAGSRRSQLTSLAANAIGLPAAITAVASTATSRVELTGRPRTAAEEALGLSSDVRTLSNTLPSASDAFVLQMAYDPTLPWLVGKESQLIDAGLIVLASDASGDWENAVLSNTAGSPLWMGDTNAPTADLASKLGWYGVD
ncbi:MAG: autotransporter-associated beta strand repeat-containing protein, partial [Patescibacteria group bacterium]|nr:autotransporter-associated beta strand repeat-containing protein [Patescibacteria group bacterium]